MPEFKVRKDYYVLMIEIEHSLYHESYFYYQYLDARKYGHYFTFDIDYSRLQEFRDRLCSYIEAQKHIWKFTAVKTVYRILNEIDDILESSHAAQHTQEAPS